MLEAEINAAGDVLVEGQHVGSLQGFRFTPDAGAAGEAAKALNAAAQKALAGEFEARATRVFNAVDDAFVLGNDGVIRWLGEPVGKIAQGASVLTPAARVLADEQLSGAALEKVQQRLDLWLTQHVTKLLGPLQTLEKGEGLEGVARGVAFQVAEDLGVLDRARVARDVKNFSQDDRASLRKLGVRFGAYHLYLPLLLKPAPRALASLLWALHHGGLENVKGLEEVPHYAASGRTSFAADPAVHKGFYRAAGFRACGERAVRVDILERLADLIRPAIAYRPGQTAGDPPPGTADGEGFVVTVAMTSLTGCSGEAFSSILKSLGYSATNRPGPAITVPLIAAASTEPVRPTAAPEGAESGQPEAEVVEPVEETEPKSEAEGAPQTDPASPADGAEALASVDDGEREAATPVAEATDNEIAAASEDSEPLDAETTAESAGAETASEAGGDGGEAPQPAEPATIEIWAMQRHTFSGPRRSHGGRPTAGEGESDRRPSRRDFRPRTDAAAGQPGSGAEGGRQEAGAGGKPRFDKPRFDKGRSDRPRGDRPPREDNRRGGRPAFAGAEKRERQPDPDSPFAKLAALKAELEKKGK